MTGFFLSSPLTLLLLPAAVLALGWFGANRWGWAALGLFTALGLGLSGLWLAGAVLVLALLVTPQVRTPLVSGPLMRLMSRLGFLPKVSKTEKEALEAGTTWADAELFSGKPNFDRLRAEAYPGLTAEEQAFLDGPVEEVCRMTDGSLPSPASQSLPGAERASSPGRSRYFAAPGTKSGSSKAETEAKKSGP